MKYIKTKIIIYKKMSKIIDFELNLDELEINIVSNILHSHAYDMAMSTIPEMFVPTNMIILNGKINDKDIKILLDTGASTSVISNKAVEKLDLSDLVDKMAKTKLQGIGSEESMGRLWYIELDINNMIFPVSLIVSKMNFPVFDIILGINFLQSYNANIDFKNKKIILNDKYQIYFS